jgi:hypothetical protein
MAAGEERLNRRLDPRRRAVRTSFSHPMRAFLPIAAPLTAAVMAVLAGYSVGAQQPRGLRTTPEQPAIAKGRDYALLFATDQYKDRAWRPLRNPLRDATAIAEELQENYGFTEARVVRNPTHSQILNTLKEYLDKRRFEDNDQLFIFFAGHGLYRPQLDLGYIVASDSKGPDDDPTDQSYLSFETLYRYVDRIRAKHIFLVLDVCHGGTFAEAMAMRGDPARSDYDAATPTERVSRILRRTTRKYLTSGGNEYVPDGSGAHSPFAAKFLEALRRRTSEGILTATDVYQVVRQVRPNEPVFGDFGKYEPVSDFVFVATASAPVNTAPPSSSTDRRIPPPPADRAEARPLTEVAAISSALSEYKEAYERLELDRLLAVAPFLRPQRSELERQFKQLSSLSLELTTEDPVIDGGRATVAFREVRTPRTLVPGKQPSSTQQGQFVLVKHATGAWVIESQILR